MRARQEHKDIAGVTATASSLMGLAMAIALLGGCAGGLNNTAATEKQAVSEAKKNLVCRSEKRTGTNLTKSNCRSAEEWAVIDRKQQSDARETTRRIDEGAAVSGAENNGPDGAAAGY